jgi:hypothetical protein
VTNHGFFSAHRAFDPVAEAWQRLAAEVIGKAFSDEMGDGVDSNGYKNDKAKHNRHVARVQFGARLWIQSENYYPWDAALGIDSAKIARGLREALAAEDKDWARRQARYMRMSWRGHERNAS